MNPEKSYISIFSLTLLVILTGCPLDKEDEKPKEKVKLTDEFLWYRDGDPLRIKVWYGTAVNISYYLPNGSIDKSEELLNNKAWVMKFSDSGPYSNENSYLWRDAQGVLDGFMTSFGRYELNSSKNQITFGNFKDWHSSEEKTMEDITFDITFKEDFLLSDWLKFTNIKTSADGSRVEISFTLSD